MNVMPAQRTHRDELRDRAIPLIPDLLTREDLELSITAGPSSA